MDEAEKQAILKEQAGRLAEAKARAAQAPPPPAEEPAMEGAPVGDPGVVSKLIDLLRGALGMQREQVVKAAADALPETLMPHKALDLEAQKRAQIDAMLRENR